MNRNPLCTILALSGILLASAGCNHQAVHHGKTSTGVPVVVTATVLGSIVAEIGKPYVDVENLVPAGASVEDFEPAPREAALLHDAHLLVENGGGYEIWLSHLIENASNPELHTLVASLGMPLIHENPHLWMDPERARRYARRIALALCKIDPLHASTYRHNEKIYDRSLVKLEKKIRHALAKVPPTHRWMLVEHDAWVYYNRRFGLKTLGVIEPAPGREPSAEHIAMLIQAARRKHIHAVFSEPEESPRLAQEVAANIPHGHVVPLYVDSLDTDRRVSDYRAMLWLDTQRIVQALK